ncbi:uncharacterized protein [Nicotiana tomentosiformis]|uniref:uncharacterized protein n=1 Tax=Nicotiana tomentosiformis TaxID=4098 RepID=UPI00388CC6C0
MENNQPKKMVEELAAEYYQRSTICFGNHLWFDCQAVRQPPQGEIGSLEELMYNFINKVEERFIQDDEAINNLTVQVSQIISTLSKSSLRCDDEYMEVIPCENEPTQEDEQVQREISTVQEDSDSTQMIENKALVKYEATEEEFKPSSIFPHLQHVVEENEKQMEYVWIDPVKEYRNKLRIIMNEQFTAQDDDEKERKERVFTLSPMPLSTTANSKDWLASEKETAQAKLASVQVQLWVAKEKADKRSQLKDELRAYLISALTERDALSKEYEAINSKLNTTYADTEEMVAQYKADVKAAEARLKTNAEYMRRLSRRETLEEIHARGFDLSAEIEEAKKLEAKAKKLYEPEGAEDSEGSEESEGSDDFGAK